MKFQATIVYRGIEQFNKRIDDLLDEMQNSLDNGSIASNIVPFQSRLNKLARVYNNDASIGRLRYKLYEAQAYLCYFKRDNDKALQFIREAVRVRGRQFDEATNFEQLVLQQDALHGSNVATSPRGHTAGWPAFFVASLGIGALYNLYLGLTGWNSISSLTPDINAAYPNLRSLMIVEQIVPLLAAGTAGFLITLIVRRKRVAHTFGICFFTVLILWLFVDSIIASSMFLDNQTMLNGINSSVGGDGRLLFFDIAWLLYLIFSKQLKRMLSD